MRMIATSLAAVCLATAGASAIAPMAATAGAAAAITVENPHARPSLGAAKNSAAYMVIRNSGPADKLLAAEGSVARRIELHTHLRKQVDGKVVMQMRQVPHIPLPEKGEVRLQQGGLHIMLMGLNKKLRPGDSFRLRLVFEKNAPLEITVPVNKLSSTMMHDMKNMQHMKH